MIKIGDKIKILNENGQYNKWADKVWEIDEIFDPKKEDGEKARGYDMGVYPEKLISCKNLPVSLYEYEIEVI